MSAMLLRFPAEPARDVATARMIQQVAAGFGGRFSFHECLEIVRESKHRELTEEGKAIARDIARQLGIALRPE